MSGRPVPSQLDQVLPQFYVQKAGPYHPFGRIRIAPFGKGGLRVLAESKYIKEITNPLRRNDLEARRGKLGLSRVALGRILDVDPATVFRRERGPLAALWDYAMRGIEAEAREAKPVLRSHKGDLERQTFMPDQFAAQGFAFTGEKMNQARRQHAQEKLAASGKRVAPTGTSREPRSTGQSAATKQLADKYIPDPNDKK